jgi:glycosyltransferase involved in cell wall biosynthesis
MTLTLDADTDRGVLLQHLLTVAPVLLPSAPTDGLIGLDGLDAVDGTGASELLDRLVTDVHRDLRADRLWVLFVALASRYPTGDEMSDGLRIFELSGVTDATLWLLDSALAGAATGSLPGQEIELVNQAVLIDVDHSARHDLHTGVQQVVRHLLPRWVRAHGVTPVAWTPWCGTYRPLQPKELLRILSWGESRSTDDEDEDPTDIGPLLVPWRCLVVTPEVPFGEAPERLSTLARFSGNQLAIIGYDCIPVVSADLVPVADTSRFVKYLSMVKHAHRVAAISASATVEFQGFADALPTQGLVGPVVVECMLPTPPPADPALPAGAPTAAAAAAAAERPSVLMVGSLEPRKNHLGVLHAAEKLWREGLDFDLTFICGSGWGSELPDRIAELQHAGRPLTVLRNADEDVLQRSYRTARFSVFPSMHEGFGLPVAESFAAGTPVITSDFGSLREIASGGGALMIDPHDDAALERAMRILLTDDAELHRLQGEIGSRPRRDWDDYARELWDVLAAPLVTVDPEAEPAR